MNDVVSDEVIIRVVLIVIELSDRNMIFDGRKFEFWMKKNYSIDDMFIRCIYVCINSNN